jgi:hypothetical protein
VQAYIFSGEIANVRHDVTIHTRIALRLFYYLLNPSFDLNHADEVDTSVNFLDIEESGHGANSYS